METPSSFIAKGLISYMVTSMKKWQKNKKMAPKVVTGMNEIGAAAQVISSLKEILQPLKHLNVKISAIVLKNVNHYHSSPMNWKWRQSDTKDIYFWLVRAKPHKIILCVCLLCGTGQVVYSGCLFLWKQLPAAAGNPADSGGAESSVFGLEKKTMS